MTKISGNTYPVKDQIKALGGKWDADQKAWMVPDGKAADARKLVAGAPKQPFTGAAKSASNYGPRKCVACGHVEERNRRGYLVGDRILASGECQSCYQERKMGY